MNENEMELKLCEVEEMLVRFGARPAENIDEKRRNTLGLRMSYVYKGTYFRTECDELDGIPVILIYGIDDPAYANVGIDDALTAFPADSPREKMEEEIRKLLEEDY